MEDFETTTIEGGKCFQCQGCESKSSSNNHSTFGMIDSIDKNDEIALPDFEGPAQGTRQLHVLDSGR